jgi:AbrB family looped-hinge helix DNA binding protein
MVVGISSISRKGQVTIPKEVRDYLGLKAGDKVVFTIEGSRVVVRKASSKSLVEILESARSWDIDALEFQRKIRREWS